MLKGEWKGLVWPGSPEAVREPETGVDTETLVKVGKASTCVPGGFVSFLPSFAVSSRMDSFEGCIDPIEHRKFIRDYTDMSITGRRASN